MRSFIVVLAVFVLMLAQVSYQAVIATSYQERHSMPVDRETDFPVPVVIPKAN